MDRAPDGQLILTRALWLLSPAAVALAAVVLAGCPKLELRRVNTSVRRPSNVALYFAVETSDGQPVAGLDAKQFRIYEDGRLISPYESKQTILNPDVAVSHYMVLLMDLSGSIVESGSLPKLIKAASAFTERVARGREIAIYGFDGRKRLIPVSGFTGDAATVKAALARLEGHRVKDPSTNLNGAVIHAIKKIKRRMARSSRPLTFGTLVVFSDGADRAHRVTAKKMYQVVEKSPVNVFVIGLGGEMRKGELSRLGRDGYITADDKNIKGAFDQVANRIEAQGRKFYLLSYCSPSRAGKHRLRVEVTWDGKSGSLEHEFDARGFRPGCDPKQKPTFSLRRVRLKRRKK